jgi:hypothetical protein
MPRGRQLREKKLFLNDFSDFYHVWVKRFDAEGANNEKRSFDAFATLRWFRARFDTKRQRRPYLDRPPFPLGRPALY